MCSTSLHKFYPDRNKVHINSTRIQNTVGIGGGMAPSPNFCEWIDLFQSFIVDGRCPC